MKEMKNRSYSCPPLDLLADETKSGASLPGVLEESAQEDSVLALGRDLSGTPVTVDLAKEGHLLIAGRAGSGKDMCIRAILYSMLRADPGKLGLILINSKAGDLSDWQDALHLLRPVTTNAEQALEALRWAVTQVHHRLACFEKHKGVRSIGEYNRIIGADEEPMARIIVVIDELGDLMDSCGDEAEKAIMLLAPWALRTGIHLVAATQRVDRAVISGIIKANFPSRIAFRVDDEAQSKLILDMSGAEKLEMPGEMLLMALGTSELRRINGCFVSDDEVERAVRISCEKWRSMQENRE